VTAGAAGWAGHRAASLARRAGACDHLITAALAHDFARCCQGHDEEDVTTCSASLLVEVFPDPVLEPMRSLAREADTVPAGTTLARYAIAQGQRLRAYVHAARTCSDDALLSWQALLKIARRVSLDG
jgi:predicted HD phosphohydrolase